jgi:hypothetical protein
MSVIAKRRKKNIQAIEYLDKEKEVVRRVRKRKNATKNALDNGDLNINGRKMSKRSDNLNVKEVAKRARMRKSAEKKALENGGLHMNGWKMRERSGDLNVKEVARRVRRKKSTEKKALKNGDLHMNGMKMKSGEEAVVMKIPKRGRG